ncbi:MAG: hypothetical protein KF763_17755 [Cyclobacteriaceae bacterium]|nr:hypothetical protein [Cyclobacteriaceae bacterium]
MNLSYKPFAFVLFAIALLLSCNKEEQPPTRTFRMGFQNSAPRFDNLDLFIQSLNLWTSRADVAMITTEVPWEQLLTGTSVNDFVVNNYKELVTYYKTKNFKLWIYIDPQNGLDRGADAVYLQQIDKSIADADIQLLYQKFTIAMDSILNPEHLGLALETNLIRDAAPASIYNGVKTAVNATAQAVRARNATVPLSVSVQVDHAWGKLVGGNYAGVAQDFDDFPFIQELGLSSYPYFGFNNPKDIPINYYSKLVEGKPIPVFITEGGWASESVTTPDRSFVSSPELQKAYIEHHTHLLNEVKAAAVFQLVFTDIDLTAVPDDIPNNIGYFLSLGLVDVNLNIKPALSAWDEVFGYRYTGND